MKVLFRNILTKLFRRKHAMRKSGSHAARAQSFLEFALLLPLLLILLLIMVELGFVMNAYLSLLDSTRQAARVYSGFQPFEITTDTSTTPATVTKTDKMSYYSDAATLLIETLNSNSYQIKFNDPPGSVDNILVSVIGVDVNTVPNPDTITIIRHPGSSQYWAFSTDSVNAGYTSKYADDATIQAYMTKGGSTAVTTGLLIIEVYYGYEGTLQVPGIRFFDTTIGFATDENPLVLYAYSVMPLSQAKP
jgi:Flp pilus assembly protein TadG